MGDWVAFTDLHAKYCDGAQGVVLVVFQAVCVAVPYLKALK